MIDANLNIGITINFIGRGITNGKGDLGDNYHGVMAIGKGGVHLVHRHGVHAGHLVLLLPLHPPVLEPDLDLSLSQAEGVGNLNSEK